MATDQELFEGLYILDMANSHEGSVEHGLRIVDEMAAVVKKHGVRSSVKLQYRDFDTLIHPDYFDREDVKHIPRFLANRLSWDDFKKMIDRMREHGLVVVVTPSDEVSVEKCLEHDVDIIKVPSPAAQDWPYLAKVAEAGKPVIVSTGGLTLAQIDEVVDFFRKREVQFAIEHCVSVYPTENGQVHMNFMKRLIKRYPNLVVGWSGHEGPENLDVAMVAAAAGAKFQERHVGIPTPEKDLNAYSMNPEQVDKWIDAISRAQAVLGSDGDKVEQTEEQEALASLARGVWAKRDIKEGERLAREDVFYAMPMQEGQMTSGEFGKHGATVTASRDYKADEPVLEEVERGAEDVAGIVREVKGVLREAGIEPGENVEIELSHHEGLENFGRTGAAIVNILNREYCKKLIVMLPGQSHPEHMHKVKEEAFHVVWGDVKLMRDGEAADLKAGDVAVVERGQWHSFASDNGVVFEEISTTHVKGDSYYKDPDIANMQLSERKTIVENT